MKPVAFTFISIATGKYTEYLVASIESYRSLRIETPIQWVILTDDVPGMRSKLEDNVLLQFTFIEIPSLGWPDATLLRYELISSVESTIVGPVIVYLDADMRFVTTPTFLEPNWQASASLTFTLHPGFYVRNLRSLLSLTYQSPRTFIRFLKVRLSEKGFGTWENRRTSAAFVSKNERKNYVCGGIWFGERDKVLGMCKILSSRTKIDSASGIVARFHDESHLNWFITQISDLDLLPPENCFAEGYANLKELTVRVIAVEKEISHL